MLASSFSQIVSLPDCRILSPEWYRVLPRYARSPSACSDNYFHCFLYFLLREKEGLRQQAALPRTKASPVNCHKMPCRRQNTDKWKQTIRGTACEKVCSRLQSSIIVAVRSEDSFSPKKARGNLRSFSANEIRRFAPHLANGIGTTILQYRKYIHDLFMLQYRVCYNREYHASPKPGG